MMKINKKAKSSWTYSILSFLWTFFFKTSSLCMFKFEVILYNNACIIMSKHYNMNVDVQFSPHDAFLE